MIGNLKLRSCMINMDTEKDYGEAHLNPLQRQNMRIFIEATKSLMDSVGEEGLSIRKIAAKAGYNSATIYNYFQDLDGFRELFSRCFPKGPGRTYGRHDVEGPLYLFFPQPCQCEL